MEYIEIPCTLNNLVLEKAKEKDINYLSDKLGKAVSADKITVLACDEGRFYVVARMVNIFETRAKKYFIFTFIDLSAILSPCE